MGAVLNFMVMNQMMMRKHIATLIASHKIRNLCWRGFLASSETLRKNQDIG